MTNIRAIKKIEIKRKYAYITKQSGVVIRIPISQLDMTLEIHQNRVPLSLVGDINVKNLC